MSRKQSKNGACVKRARARALAQQKRITQVQQARGKSKKPLDEYQQEVVQRMAAAVERGDLRLTAEQEQILGHLQRQKVEADSAA